MDGKNRHYARPFPALTQSSLWMASLFLLALLLLAPLASWAGSADFWVDARPASAGLDATYYSWSGTWGTTSLQGSCGKPEARGYADATGGAYTGFTVTPTVQATQFNQYGYYDFKEWHVGNTNSNTNLLVTPSIQSGGAQISGFGQFQWSASTSTTCTGYGSLGRFRVMGNSVAVRFTRTGGTALGDVPGRWYVNTMEFIQAFPTTYLLTLNAGANGTVAQQYPGTGGQYAAGEQVTVIATPNSGYNFANWTDAGGNVKSTSATYTFTMPGSAYTLNANFSGNSRVTVVPNPTGAGTITGDGLYAPGSNCTLTATGNGYTFSGWTADQPGSIVLSTANPYSFTVSGDTTIYAQFSINTYNLTQAVSPSGGGTFVAGSTSGPQTFNAPCTESAIPNAGYDFVGWSFDGGTTISSRLIKGYTFNMPAGASTITAVFVPQAKFCLIDGFDSYNGSGAGDNTSAGILDSNATGSVVAGMQMNTSANGTGSNPWWGCTGYNGEVLTSHDSCAGPHAGALGAKIISGWQGLQADNLNFAFRKNGGNLVSGGFYADWWFYDYCGQSNNLTTNFAYIDDAFSVCNLKNWASNLDYVAGSTTLHYGDSDFYTRISLGAANDTTTGWDYTKYQARIYSSTGYPSGVPGAYGSLGWVNLPKTRGVGWHHCRMVFGPVKTTGTNDVTFFVDDMNTSLLTTDTFSPYTGYNMAEIQEMYWPVPRSNALPYFAIWDDVNIASTPGINWLKLSSTLVLDSSPVTATWDGVGADHYLVQVDGGAWSTQSSPYSISTTGMLYGSHTFNVRAVDAGGNQGGIASATFTVDTSSIRTWATIGSYTKSGATPIDTEYFSPDATDATACASIGKTLDGLAWRSYTSPTRNVDFDVMYGSNHTNCATYLFTYVMNSGPALPNTYIACGSDDSIKIYVNGNQVWRNDLTRGVVIDQDLSTAFTLNPGLNTLLIKETQGTGGEGVQARFCKSDKSDDPVFHSQLTYLNSDDTAPTGGAMLINGGATSTTSQTVTLSLTPAVDGGPAPVSGMGYMSFSNDGVTYSAPEPLAATKSWALIAGNGAKTVYTAFLDNAHNAQIVSASINLVSNGHTFLAVPNPTAGGTTSGGGIMYSPGGTVNASATPNADYTFTGWTSDQAGTTVVSTANPYTFAMPSSDYTLYAQFSLNTYPLTVHANAGGTLGTDPSGAKHHNDSCFAVAVPNAGYYFKGWTTAADGSGTVLSASTTYTVTMPAAAYNLYANFGTVTTTVFSDGFESYAAGDIDSNHSAGPNTTANGTGSNPWFGADPTDATVTLTINGVTPHSGTKMIYGLSGTYNLEDAVNVGFRLNNDHIYSQNIFMDWWFYDPLGATGTNYTDFAGINWFPRNPILGDVASNQDYNLTAASYTGAKNFHKYWANGAGGQLLGLGASWDKSSGYNAGVYQYHVTGLSGAYANGWFNTSKARTVGWHHAKISVGPVKPATGTNDVSFFIDDMSTAIATADSATTTGYNAVSTYILQSGMTTGYMDDISFGPTVDPPVAAAAIPGWNSTTGQQITWNWTESSTVTGFKIYDAATGGNLIATTTGPTPNYTETGLTGNTQYSRWVTAYTGAETARVALPPTYTWADQATLGVNANTAADTSSWYYAGNPWPGFTNPQGFGTASGLVTSYKYKWSTNFLDTLADGAGTTWNTDPMMAAPTTAGTYYLFVRSYNAIGVSNPNVAVLGPYNFGDPTAMHSIFLQSCEPTYGTPTGPGSSTGGTSVTVHANPAPGYSFLSWTRDSCDGFDVASRSKDYTFNMPTWDVNLYANYTANSYTLNRTACTGGTVSGDSGSFQTGTTVAVSATASTGYKFSNWTTDSCGGTAIASTSASYSFPMTPNNLTLFANFVHLPHLILTPNPSGGGMVFGDGFYDSGTAVTVTAHPYGGYDFKGWSTDSAGATIVSRASQYSITTGSSDATYYAQFVPQTKWTFNDGFEGYAGSGSDETTYGSLDSNTAGGANASANGTGWNPWWGCGPPNGEVMHDHDGANPHSGQKMMTAWASSNMFDYVNFAFRRNGGNSVSGNFYADWWFYDQKGQSNNITTAFAYQKDAFSVVNYKNYTYNLDYPTSGLPTTYLDDTAFYTRISLGCGDEVHNGWDYHCYQARIFSSAGVPASGSIDGLYSTNGWINLTAAPRSVGWHHCRMLFGPSKSTGTNDVSFYIDDMASPKLIADSFSPITGYNMIETQELTTVGSGATGDPYGYFNKYDDINVGSLPGTANLVVSPAGPMTPGTAVTATWDGVGADHYMVQINSGSWTQQSSPYVIDTTNLPYGTNTVRVKAVDAGGNEGGVVSATFSLDRSIGTWNIIGHYPWQSGTAAGSTRWATDMFAPATTELDAAAKSGASYASTVVPTRGSWVPFTTTTAPTVDLNVFYNGSPAIYTQYGVSYLFNYVINSSGVDIPNCYLSCGSDDGIKVFVNSAYIGGTDIYRACVANSDLYGPFTLVNGPNRLLVKVTQGTGGYQMQAQLCKSDRSELAAVQAGQITYIQSDENAPTGCSIQINGGAASTSNPAVTLTLFATDTLSGVSRMKFSDDGVTFGTPVAYSATAPYTLPGSDGPKTVYVEFIDRAGNVSAPVSAGITLSTAPPCTPPTGTTNVPKISGLWALVDGTTVYNLTGKTVSAVWTDGFWIQETDRTAGVKVMYSPATACTVGAAIAAGKSVDVYGTISTGDQRVVNATVVVNNGATNPIKPVGVTEKYTGGKAKSNAPAVTGGKGIYGVGLLVKLAGNVTSADTVGGTFYLDDGSGLTDGTYNGIKVYAGALSVPTSGNKEVTGVVGIVAGKPVIYATAIQ